MHCAKNAVLPILAASLLTDEPVTIQDCPSLTDTGNMVKILETLGVKAKSAGRDITLDAGSASKSEMPDELSKQLRSSIFMMGALLGRFRKATLTYPGGCEIGLRPIDLHLKALRTLGVRIRETHGMIYCDGSSMRGAKIHLDFPSVGATENVMMAAVLSPGETSISNPAREPEIVDLARFINRMGGDIRGAGSGLIEITGAQRLRGTTYRPLPDRIVTGTLLTAAAMTAGEIEIVGVEPSHLNAVLDKLTQAGCKIDAQQGRIQLAGPARLLPIDVNTQPYPGFPTDMQAQILAMACLCDGTSVIVENMFENRFSHASQLRCMGADILVSGSTAVVKRSQLTGARVTARDLRGGAALVLAGLAAEGTTEVTNTHFIDRGYEALERTLRALGAKIERV